MRDPREGTMPGTSKPDDISPRLDRIAKLARQLPDRALNTLAHHVDVEFLREAYRRTRKDGAVGVDGRTAAEYAANLEANLRSLLDRFKSGLYRAPPVRGARIPKADGGTRSLGIPTFEDKVLQRAVSMLLEAVYEQDFLPCSYGFRPGRSAHQALEELWSGLMGMGGGWVLDADIQSFFDTLDHAHLRSFLDQRVGDGVIRRALGKWLKAGVLEDGALKRRSEGTPQGGVISPLLANVYLHEVLDKWFERDVRPRLKGKAVLVRYADDFVMCFSCEEDARRVMEVLPKRFGKYGLSLHPEKTRLVWFGRPPRRGQPDHGPRPGHFDLLGFTHYWGTSRKGRWVVKRKTSAKRFTKALRRVSDWLRQNMHAPLREQQRGLVLRLKGHAGYYGITGNSAALSRFLHQVRRTWRKRLARRSRSRRMTWERYARLLAAYPLPTLRTVHSVCLPPANP